MATDRQRVVVRAIGLAFVVALVVELAFHPLGHFLAQGGATYVVSTRGVVLTIHDLILFSIALFALFSSVQWPLIFSPSPGWSFGRGFLLAIPFIAPVVLVAAISSEVFSLQGSATPAVLLALIGAALYVALAEELVLRGLAQQWLQRRLRPRTVVWLQAVLFVMLHVLGRDFAPFDALFYFIAGALLTLLVLRWRTVWVSVGVHFAWDCGAFLIEGTDIRGEHVAGFIAPNLGTAGAITRITSLTVAFILVAHNPSVQEALALRRTEAAN